VPSLGRYPHGHVPAPIQITDHIGDTSARDLLSEVLILTKMNWNSARFAERRPVTVRFADEVGTILRDAIAQVWPAAITQTCVVHLLRNSFRYASKRDWAAIAKDLKPVYTAGSEAAALDAFAEFSGKWEKRYPAIIRLWENAWAEFVPFLAFDKEIRSIICTTNAIESLNARFRRSVKARGHFPTVMWNLRPRQAAA
jgi:Transposase, Mutator family